MATNIITTEDLMEFKIELLKEIQKMLKDKNGFSSKKWLKSAEVMELLKISPGTLQNFRINRTLPYTKIGGIIFYDAEEIENVMMDNKVGDNKK